MKTFKQKAFSYLALAIAPLALLAVACGGDDDGEIKTGSEEDYVKATCKAQSQFLEDFLSAALSLSEDASEEDQLNALKDPVKDLVKAMRDARPPEDLVAYHTAVREAADAMEKAIDDGDLAAFDAIDIGGSELSSAQMDRLNTVAASLDECEGIDEPF